MTRGRDRSYLHPLEVARDLERDVVIEHRQVTNLMCRFEIEVSICDEDSSRLRQVCHRDQRYPDARALQTDFDRGRSWGLASAKLIARFEGLGSWSLQNLPIHIEPRTVARAVP